MTELSAEPRYWRLEIWARSLRQRLTSLIFGTREGARGRIRGARQIAALFRVAARRAIVPLVIAALAAVADLGIHAVLESRHVAHTHLRQDVIYNAATIVLQVTVVLAGLYYAAVSIVISTVYRQSESGIVELATEGVPGEAYLRATLSAGTFAAIVAAKYIAGLSNGVVTVTILVAAVVLQLEAFARAGKMAFALFDPRSLLGELGRRFADHVSSVTAGNSDARDPDLQNTHSIHARADIEIIADIARIAHAERASLGSVSAFAFNVLRYYLANKSFIPDKSYWYTRTNAFTDWLSADPISKTTALNTMTQLKPEQFIDRSWVETRLLRIISFVGSAVFERCDETEVLQFCTDAVLTIEAATKSFELPVSKRIIEVVEPLALSGLRNKRLNNADTVKLRFHVAEMIGVMLTSVSLGHRKAADTLTNAAVESALAGESHAGSPLPQSTIDLMDGFRSGWQLEETAEGRRVTPMAYVAQFVAADLASLVTREALDIVTYTEGRFSAIIAELRGIDGDGIATNGFLSAALETTQKLGLMTLMASRAADRLKPTERLEDAGWQNQYLPEPTEVAGPFRDNVILEAARAAIPHVNTFFDRMMPDFVGAAYNHAAIRLYDALAAGESTTVESLASDIVALGIALVRSSASRAEVADLARTSGALALDLFELGGYALIYTAVYQTDVSAQLIRVIDEAIGSAGSPGIKAYTVLAGAANTPLVSGGRYMLRLNWERRLRDELERRGLLDRGLRYSRSRTEPGPHIVDPLLRSVVSYGDLAADAYTVFVAGHLMDLDPDLDINDKTRRFRERYLRVRDNPRDDVSR